MQTYRAALFGMVVGGMWLGIQFGTDAAEVTFNRDVAPILHRSCAGCHRPGEAAPFALLTYQDAVRKARTVAKATEARVMPPWKPEPASYPYRDERRLAQAEIEIIQRWVKAGTPEGPGPSPTPPKFSSDWRLGEPDLVVEMPAAYHMPADGPDVYRNMAVPLGLTEDKWITAIDMRPSARAVVHHVLYFADPTGKIHKRPSQGSEPGFGGMRAGRSTLALGGWAVGGQANRLPEGLSLRLPKQSDFIVQYHFHPTGKPESEKSKIGFYFAKQPAKRTLTRIQLPPHYSLFAGLDIPAGQKDFVIRDSYVLPADVEAVSVGAHAHYIARELKLTATLPSGEAKTLLWIKDWDFAWQDRYMFRDLVPLPKGTRLDSEIHWDNSAENPHNPASPPVRVQWGEESRDEMGSISLLVVPQAEAELAVLKGDIDRRQLAIAIERMARDPALAQRVREFLKE